MSLSVYNLGGLRLEVSSDDEDLTRRFSHLVRALASHDASGPPFRLNLKCGALPSEPDAEPVFEGEVLRDGLCRLHAEADTSLLVQVGRGALYVSTKKLAGELTVLPGHATAVTGMLGISAIEAAAHASGQAMLHVAALTLPTSVSRAMVLLHAPSGAGKTTTSLALMEAGFGLASDDAAFIRDRGGFTAWGLPRDLKVHRNTLAMMPWLAPLLAGDWSDEDERRLPCEALAPAKRLEPPESLPVAALFRLVRTDGPSTIRPVSRADLLASLAADNVRTSRAGLLPMHRHRFNTMAALAMAVPVYELVAGHDLDRLAPLVANQVAALPARRS
jgi:hypothetical protein